MLSVLLNKYRQKPFARDRYTHSDKTDTLGQKQMQGQIYNTVYRQAQIKSCSIDRIKDANEEF